MQGQRGVSGKLGGACFLKVPRGRGASLSARSCIQMHSSGTPGLPFTSSATAPLVCDMDTSTALPYSHNTQKIHSAFVLLLLFLMGQLVHFFQSNVI